MADLDPNKALAIKALLESRLPPATEGEDLATHLAEQIRHREMIYTLLKKMAAPESILDQVAMGIALDYADLPQVGDYPEEDDEEVSWPSLPTLEEVFARMKLWAEAAGTTLPTVEIQLEYGERIRRLADALRRFQEGLLG